MTYEVIRSDAAAEHAVVVRAQRRYRNQDAEAIERDVLERMQKAQHQAIRLFNQFADIGVALMALRAKIVHGTYLDRIERLGISKSSADRYRRAAIVREMLPEKPPPELYREIWTLNDALEFGETKMALLGTMPDDKPWSDEEANLRTIAKIRARRRAKQSTGLPQKVLRLEAELATAIHSDDLGAQQALDAWINAAKRLDQMARQLASSGEEDVS